MVYKCPECGDIFNSETDLKTHGNNHEKPAVEPEYNISHNKNTDALWQGFLR